MGFDQRIIINPGSGTQGSSLFSDIQQAVRDKALNASVEQAGSPDQITSLARQALDSGIRTIIACGGDGTVSAIASVVCGTGRTLGVIPGGTLNHFAKDLAIPLDLAGAVAVLARGHVSTIDTGEVNERIFINNSSLGLYPEIVRLRNEQQSREGRSKWPAMLRAFLAVLGRNPFIRVRLQADGNEIFRRTTIVFIGNNEYSLEGFDMGTRRRLDAGRLCLCMPRHAGSLRLLGMAAQAVLGRLQKTGQMDAFCVKELRIETRRRALHVAIDGELLHMATPLIYRIRPASLKVLTPAADEAQL